MPLDRIVLYAVAALAAILAAFVAVALLGQAVVIGPAGVLVIVPAAFLAYVFGRVLVQRLSNAPDRRYDDIER